MRMLSRCHHEKARLGHRSAFVPEGPQDVPLQDVHARTMEIQEGPPSVLVHVPVQARPRLYV